MMGWSELLDPLRTLGIAAALGGVIGLERELARRPAGLRTHILVAVAAALIMVLGEGILESFAAEQGSSVVRTDPVRIIQAIIVGISFLGTGTVIHERGARVEGLTTAASILLTAGVAIAVAAHRELLATVVAFAMTALLVALGKVESLLGTDVPPPSDREPAERPRQLPQTGG